MPEKMNQSPAEMLNQNAAVAQNAEVPAPAAPVTPARQSYAEKVQGLTIDERNWMLAKSKAAAMAQLPEGFLPQTYTGNPGACAIACEMALRMGVSHLSSCRTFTSSMVCPHGAARAARPSSTTAASLQAAPATAWRARRAPKPGGAV